MVTAKQDLKKIMGTMTELVLIWSKFKRMSKKTLDISKHHPFNTLS